MPEKITVRSLAGFVLPSILLMVFIAAYTAVDSVFISRLAGPEALAGLNIVMPLYSIAFACGIMFASGGGAITAVRLGQGRTDEAGRNFSSLVLLGTAFGIVSGLACIIFREQLLTLLGAAGEIRQHAMTYGLFMMLTFPFMILKVVTESMLRAAGVPGKALRMTVIGGAVNIVLDIFFMGPLGMGIGGAGLGTLLGIAVSLPFGFSHFLSDKSVLRFRPARPDPVFLARTLSNGSSEMVNEASIALTTFVLNLLALRFTGEAGLSALAVIMSLNFLNTSVVFGYTTGVSPLISYNYGRGRRKETDLIIRYSFGFILISSAAFFLLNFAGAVKLAGLFLEKDAPAYALAVRGLKLYSFSFLFTGLDLFGSALFTAFGNGRVSALISFLKSFVFFAAAALLLPPLFGVDGIWLIRPVIQLAAIAPVIYFMRKYREEYGYSLQWSDRSSAGRPSSILRSIIP